MNSKTLSPARSEARRAASLGRVAWVPEADLEFPDWVAVGRRLGAVGRGCQWWIGDWIRYGKAKFGERYAQASRVTGYDTQTLMNMVYVSSRFEISRRREVLSWSHHETVAALEPEEQDRWLDLATAQRLSVSDLRIEMRSFRRREGRVVGDSGGAVSTQEAVVCPNCGQRIA